MINALDGFQRLFHSFDLLQIEPDDAASSADASAAQRAAIQTGKLFRVHMFCRFSGNSQIITLTTIVE